MKIFIPPGKRQMDLLSHSPTAWCFGGKVTSDVSPWQHVADVASVLLAILFVISLFHGLRQGALPIIISAVIVGILALFVFLQLRTSRLHSAKHTITIDVTRQAVRLAGDKRTAGEYPIREISLLLHAAEGHDAAQLTSTAWWLSLMIPLEYGDQASGSLQVALYGPARRGDLMAFLNQLQEIGPWREVAHR